MKEIKKIFAAYNSCAGRIGEAEKAAKSIGPEICGARVIPINILTLLNISPYRLRELLTEKDIISTGGGDGSIFSLLHKLAISGINTPVLPAEFGEINTVTSKLNLGKRPGETGPAYWNRTINEAMNNKLIYLKLRAGISITNEPKFQFPHYWHITASAAEPYGLTGTALRKTDLHRVNKKGIARIFSGLSLMAKELNYSDHNMIIMRDKSNIPAFPNTNNQILNPPWVKAIEGSVFQPFFGSWAGMEFGNNKNPHLMIVAPDKTDLAKSKLLAGAAIDYTWRKILKRQSSPAGILEISKIEPNEKIIFLNQSRSESKANHVIYIDSEPVNTIFNWERIDILPNEGGEMEVFSGRKL